MHMEGNRSHKSYHPLSNLGYLTLVLLNELMPHPYILILGPSNYLTYIVDINSQTYWQTVKIQISWLLQKPTDLDLHCLQRQDISRCSRTRVKQTLVEKPKLFAENRCLLNTGEFLLLYL